MSGRLAIAIITTLLYEAALVALSLWGLPYFGVRIPPDGLIALMVILGAYAVLTYRAGSHALARRPEPALSGMVSTRGRVVSPVDPEGMVKIAGELWQARSANGRLGIGEEVVVTAKEGLRLTVRSTRQGTVDAR